MLAVLETAPCTALGAHPHTHAPPGLTPPPPLPPPPGLSGWASCMLSARRRWACSLAPTSPPSRWGERWDAGRGGRGRREGRQGLRACWCAQLGGLRSERPAGFWLALRHPLPLCLCLPHEALPFPCRRSTRQTVAWCSRSSVWARRGEAGEEAGAGVVDEQGHSSRRATHWQPARGSLQAGGRHLQCAARQSAARHALQRSGRARAVSETEAMQAGSAGAHTRALRLPRPAPPAGASPSSAHAWTRQVLRSRWAQQTGRLLVPTNPR